MLAHIVSKLKKAEVDHEAHEKHEASRHHYALEAKIKPDKKEQDENGVRCDTSKRGPTVLPRHLLRGGEIAVDVREEEEVDEGIGVVHVNCHNYRIFSDLVVLAYRTIDWVNAQ